MPVVPESPDAMVTSSRSLAEELQEADPSLQIFHEPPEEDSTWPLGQPPEHSPAGDSGICPSLDSSLENCPTLGGSPAPINTDFEFCENAEYIDDEMRYHGRFQKGPLNLTPAVSIETLRKHGSDENISEHTAISGDADKRDDAESFSKSMPSSCCFNYAFSFVDWVWISIRILMTI